VVSTPDGKDFSFNITGFEPIGAKFPLETLPLPNRGCEEGAEECESLIQRDKEHFLKSGWTHQFKFQSSEDAKNYMRFKGGMGKGQHKAVLYDQHGKKYAVEPLPQFAAVKPCCYGSNILAETLVFARIPVAAR